MKKLLVFLLTAILILAVASPALADDGETPAVPTEFFTWASLLTYAGAVLMTSLVTQLLKGISAIEKIPTRLFAYIVALIILLAATFFTGAFTLESAALCMVNAVVVALASSGAFDAIQQIKSNQNTK